MQLNVTTLMPQDCVILYAFFRVITRRPGNYPKESTQQFKLHFIVLTTYLETLFALQFMALNCKFIPEI